MCGIFGIATCEPVTFAKAAVFRRATRRLLEESQIRGGRSSGLCVLTKKEAVMYKDGLPASTLVQRPEYGKVINRMKPSRDFRIMIGHTRTPTKGSPRFNVNNHPIRANDIIGVHNGMISNDDVLFNRYRQHIDRRGEVDSEIIFRLIDYHISRGKSTVRATQETHKAINGSYACAFVNKNNPRYLTLFCDNFSGLVFYKYSKLGVIVFASTKSIVDAALNGDSMLNTSEASWMRTVRSACVRIDTEDGTIYTTDLDNCEINMVGGPSKASREFCRMPNPLESQRCDGECLGCEHYELISD